MVFDLTHTPRVGTTAATSYVGRVSANVVGVDRTTQPRLNAVPRDGSLVGRTLFEPDSDSETLFGDLGARTVTDPFESRTRHTVTPRWPTVGAPTRGVPVQLRRHWSSGEQEKPTDRYNPLPLRRRAFTLGVSGTVTGALAGCLSGIPLSEDETREEIRTYEASDDVALRVRTENGPITVQAVEGDEIEVDIEFSGPSREALDAVSITEERTDGALLLETEYGSAGEDVSASLSIRCPETVRIGSVQTSNGSIEVDVPRTENDTKISTSNGGIDAALAQDLDANVVATTTNGSVESSGLDLDSVEQTDTRLSGSLGDGTDTLALETTNASINIQPLSE